VHKIWRFYLQPFQRNLRGCKIIKWIIWPGPRPFQEWSFRRLKFDTACTHTKFDDSSFSRSRQISGVWNHRRRHVVLTTPTQGQLVICRLVLLVAKPCIKFEVCSFSRSEDISWVLNSKIGHVTLTMPLSGVLSCHKTIT